MITIIWISLGILLLGGIVWGVREYFLQHMLHRIERSLLEVILACERGEWAPEGWAYHAPDYSDGGNPRAWWHRGFATVLCEGQRWHLTNGTQDSWHKYAYEAIKAAERGMAN